MSILAYSRLIRFLKKEEKMEVSNEIEKNSVQNLHFQRLLVAGSANRPFVNALDLLNVEVGVLAGFGTIGIPASVALDALPDTKSLHVTFQDAYTKIDIIFDLEEIDAFLIDCFTPGRDVYLHDSNGITCIRPILNHDHRFKEKCIFCQKWRCQLFCQIRNYPIL